MSFTCKLNSEKNTIEVKENSRYIGEYYLINEPFCDKCSLPLESKSSCCDDCSTIDYHFDVACTVGLYFKWGYDGDLPYIKQPDDDLLSKHIRFLKNSKNFSSNIRWAIPLGLAMVICIENRFSELKSLDIIVPLPQHSDSIAKRGYNQSEEIAKVVGNKIGIEIRTDILHKISNVKMIGKNLQERRELVKGAYKSDIKLNGENVLLIDDTLTTGSNLDECARVLKYNGASNVCVMVAGRDVFEY